MRGNVARRAMPLLSALLVSAAALGADQARVHVDAAAAGPRPLEEQTRASVVRDYLEAWQTLGNALAENRSDLLDRSFVGLAGQQLAATIGEQSKSGVETVYRDLSHNITLTFYSPEGMSIQLVDRVEYDVQVLVNGRLEGEERGHARYVSVLTPTEVRWKVRILEAAPE